ncbi:MAG: CheR family methyltransferase [Chitinivibrionales bacterium]
MDKKTFDTIRNLVYDKAGISLNDGKQALVSARLGKRMRALNFSEYKHYLDHLHKDTSGEEIVQLLDAIATNVTSFFRESAHFDFLTEQMRKWVQGGQHRFRFWSAACSSGEEPYTMAMVLRQASEGYSTDTKILATDISTRILGKALQGEYGEEKVKTVPSKLLEKHFTVENKNGLKTYRVKELLRSMIVFKRLNLSVTPFPMHGPMDAVFCRNVMIYFDNPVRKRLLEEHFRLVKPGGFLFVGHAESLTGMLSGFKLVKPSIYEKR